MRTNEKQFLYAEKEINGKSHNQAWKEINDLEKAEKAFKILWKEKRSLEKEVEKLEKNLKEERNKNFKLSLSNIKKENIKKEKPKIYSGSLNYLKRILHFMEVGKRYTKKGLAGDLCMNVSDLNSCLNFLVEFKLLNLEDKNEGLIRI